MQFGPQNTRLKSSLNWVLIVPFLLQCASVGNVSGLAMRSSSNYLGRKEKACVHCLCALPVSPRHTLAVSSLVYDRHHAAPFCPPPPPPVLPHRQIPFSRTARRRHVRHHRAAVFTVGPHGVICKRRQLELGSRSCGPLDYIILD